MLHLKKDLKDLERFQQILLVFFEEGLGYYITKSKLHRHLPIVKQFKYAVPLTEKEAAAQALRRAFERLGPTFIKFGQLLSLRPDLVPPEFSKELEKLQDSVPSFSFELVQEIIEEDLKQPLSKLFRSIEKKPLACASMAQVHRVKLKNGTDAAVKIQRPNVKEIIDADLDILFFLAYSLEKHFPEIRSYRPVDIIKEFAVWTRKELNFEIEAGNALRLRDEMKKNKNVNVPKIFVEYSSPRVLTMEYVNGAKLDNLQALKKFHINRKKIVMTYFTSILEQALLYGFFHADPHPANIFVQKDGKLVYLDFGIMGELTLNDRKKIMKFVSSISDKDSERSLNIIISLAKQIREDRLTEFKREAMPILEQAYHYTITEKSIGHALYEIISLGARYGIIFDPNHVLIAKAIYQAEGLALKLNPRFKVSEGLEKFSEIYLQETYSLPEIMKRVRTSMSRNRELLLDFPDHLVKIIERLEDGRMATSCPQNNRLEDLQQEWEYLTRRRNIGLIVASLFIASSLLFYGEREKLLFGIPIKESFLILALLLLVYFLFSMKKPNWRDNYYEKNN